MRPNPINNKNKMYLCTANPVFTRSNLSLGLVDRIAHVAKHAAHQVTEDFSIVDNADKRITIINVCNRHASQVSACKAGI